MACRKTVEREIIDLLEWYICECITYGPKSLNGWWSDGVIHLEVAQAARDRINLLGVTWIDSHGFAPFDIDLSFDPTDGLRFTKTVFRIGLIDDQRRPIICKDNLAPTRVLEMRPQQNRDWAMAVELSPPPEI